MRVFNVLKRWLLVLVCAVSSVCAMEFTGEDVSGFSERLNSQMSELSSQLKFHQENYPDAKNVVVIGKTGAGKSTLITYLAGKLLKVADGDDGFYLTSSSRAGNVKIGHDLGVGTEAITPFFDSVQGVIYWDCPGFDDPRGILPETQNTILIQQLFKSLSQLKVLVVVKEQDIKGRATEFWKLLKKMEIFAGQEAQLNECVSLAVTQRRDITDMRKRFGDLQRSESEYLENSIVKVLIDLFVDNTSTRVSQFSFPSEVGDYDQHNREAILSNLGYATYVESLTCHVALSLESQEYVRRLAADYNTQIREFLIGDISQAIKAAVYGQISSAIERHDKMAEQLKELFGEYADRLTSLEPTNYVGGLKSLLTDLGLFSILDDSRFNLFSMLTTFGDLLGEALSVPDQWAEALEPIKQDLLRLRDTGSVDGVKTALTRRTLDHFYSNDGMKFRDRGKNKQRWDRFDVTDGVTYERTTDFGNGLILKEDVKDQLLYVVSRIRAERDNRSFKGDQDHISLSPRLLSDVERDYSIKE